MNSKPVKPQTIAFVETAVQLAALKDYTDRTGTSVHIVAVTPEVDFSVVAAGLLASNIEDYISWDELCAKGDANSRAVDEFADIFDSLIHECAGNYPRKEWVSVLAARHGIKAFFDALLFRTLPVLTALQRLHPTRVLCFPVPPYRISGINPFDKPNLSLTTAIVPLASLVYGLEIIEIPTYESFSLRGQDDPVAVVALNDPMEAAIDKIRERISKEICLLSAEVTAPVLFASTGLDGFTTAILDSWQQKGYGNVIDSAIFFDWRMLDSNLYNRDVLFQHHPYLRSVCQAIGKRLWEKLEHNLPLLRFFNVCGVDLSSVARPMLLRLATVDVPDLLALVLFVEHILRIFPKPIVMSGGMNGCNYLVGKATDELNIPFVSIHKGGFLGYSLLPMHEHYDMENCDFFICNGKGAEDTFREPSPMSYWKKGLKRAKPIPLGTPWTASIRNNGHCELKAGKQRTIMYVMSAVVGDNMYLGYAFHPQIWYYRFQQRLIKFLSRYPETKVILKPPLMDRYSQIVNPVLGWVHENIFPNVAILEDCKLTDVLDQADAFLLDSPSTPLLDILPTNKPFVAYCDQRFFRFVPDAARALNKRAVFTETEDDFFKELELFLALPDWRAARPLDDEFLIRYAVHINDGNAAGRIADFLESVLKQTFLQDEDKPKSSVLRDVVGSCRSFLPTQLAIETVRACNARCVMCPSTTMSRPHGLMSEETHRVVINKVHAWGAPIDLITHAGLGEPLLDPHLEQKIMYEKLRFPSARVVVYTNGSLLTEARVERLLNSGVDGISISINGFRRETYEQVMKLSRDVTYENVLTLLRLRDKCHAPVTVQVSLVQTEYCSDEELEEFRRYWQDQGVTVSTPPWISWGNFFEKRERKAQHPCPYIWKVLMVDNDGTVKMCCEDYDTRFPLGNLLEVEPDDIFNSYRMQEQRSRQLAGDFSWPDICRNCIETFEDHWRDVRPVPSDRRNGISAQVQQISSEIYGILRQVGPEHGKYLLGQLLAATLGYTTLDYPPGVWPPATPAREYIRQFLFRYESFVRGRCVEFFPALYRELFPQLSITSYDVWNVVPGEGVTVVADLQDACGIPDNHFDTVICTHVLSAVADPYAAGRELHRIVSPGGLVLCTVPSVLQKYAPDPCDHWRFTRDSLLAVFSPFSRKEIHAFGNQATVAGSPFYLMTYHFPEGFMKQHTEESPSVIAIAAWK